MFAWIFHSCSFTVGERLAWTANYNQTSEKEQIMQNINIKENGLTVEFGIREDGIVELLDFTAEDVANAKTTPTLSLIHI